MAYATITATIEDGIGRLVLNQPKKLNPLGTNTLRDIIDATTWFNNETQALLSSLEKSRAFTSGFDLREFRSKEATGRDGAVLGREMADAVDRMKPVTIASFTDTASEVALFLQAHAIFESHQKRQYSPYQK